MGEAGGAQAGRHQVDTYGLVLVLAQSISRTCSLRTISNGEIPVRYSDLAALSMKVSDDAMTARAYTDKHVQMGRLHCVLYSIN